MNLESGMRGDAKMTVTPTDTARAVGSGSVDVLGTPRLIALCEEATVNAVNHALTEEQSTVGMRVQFDHLQPTPVGGEVFAEAVLEKIDGKRLVFTVSAEDSGGLIGAGKITRVVIDIERFMSKCSNA